MPMKDELGSTTAQWSLSDCIVCFLILWVCGGVYSLFSSDSFLGDYPYTAACSMVLITSLAAIFYSQRTIWTLARILAPSLFLLLFYSAASSDEGFIPSLQARVELPHFILVSFSAIVAFLFTQARHEQVEASEADLTPRKVEVTQADISTFDRIVGQEHVTDSLKELAKIVHSGIRVGKKNAPHAVLLFLGPTGVGKTEAALALAEAVYGSKNALIRFDMGQFNNASQANRFYGPPPGYIGSDEGGQLTRAVLRKPKSVVLLDEMEKAHPQIWDAFLPVFDEGYIVDGSTNQKVDMCDTIIVLTSNLLTSETDIHDIPPHELKDRIAAAGGLRTELLGRINEILVFNPLNRSSIAEILRKRLDAALWSLAEQGIELSVEESDIGQLVDDVQKAKFGVRQIDDVVRGYLRKAIANRPQQDA